MTDREQHNATLGIAIAEMMQFAYYPGFAEGDEPPPVDLAAIAAYVRLLLEDARIAADARADQMRADIEIKALTAEVETYQRKLEQLYAEREGSLSVAACFILPPWESEVVWDDSHILTECET